MTWMQPNYERVNDEAALHHSIYSLYSYRDSRDPRPSSSRHGRVQKRSAPALLFVPGHAGSYQQVRSLGTHAIGLTRRSIPQHKVRQVQQSLLSREKDKNGTTAAEFVSWDVFALDFREEPTGLHGRFVEEQADFVRRAVRYLQDTLHYADVAIVAHSLGGYSSMLAVVRDNDASGRRTLTSLRTILTFATPHLHPVLTWDSTLRSIHHEIGRGLASRRNDSDLVLVSVSGGLRDEIIPPRSCDATVNAESATWMAVDLMTPPIDPGKVPPRLGMDHRAVVWCHNLLEPTVEVLAALRHDEKDPGQSQQQRGERWKAYRSARPGETTEGRGYDAAVRNQYLRLRVRFPRKP
jgi:glycosylphosphatidylinositol deacylase